MKKLIQFDWAIKRLLRNKANFVVLEGFLNDEFIAKILKLSVVEIVELKKLFQI